MQDFSNPQWVHVKAYIETEIDKARKRNDSVELDAVQTAATRGEIRALKRVLALPETAARDAQQRALQTGLEH